MLRHIESELPLMMHLPISVDNTLHFYWYLSIHALIAEGQSLLLINMPIQNRAQQLQIYEIFSLPVPYSNLSAQYKVNHKYIGMTYDETKAVAITYLQYRACQHAFGQFCRISAPFQPITNISSCFTGLFAKNNQAIKEKYSLVISCMPSNMYLLLLLHVSGSFPQSPQSQGLTMTKIYPDKATSTIPLQQPIYILRLSAAFSATPKYFHLLAYYEDHSMIINVSLDTANIIAINISTLDCRKMATF